MCGWVYDESKGIPDEESSQELSGLMCLMIGLAQYAALEKKISIWLKFRCCKFKILK